MQCIAETELETYAEPIKCTWKAALQTGQTQQLLSNQLQLFEERRSTT